MGFFFNSDQADLDLKEVVVPKTKSVVEAGIQDTDSSSAADLVSKSER